MTDPPPRRSGIEALGLGIVLTAGYWLTRTAHHAEADDVLVYALAVRDTRPGAIDGAFFHPYHLIANPIVWTIEQVATAFGRAPDPLATGQTVSAVAGGLGIAILWWLLRRTVPGRLPAIAGCGLTAVSFGYWFYSTEADVYVLAATLWLTALTALAAASDRPDPRLFALAGALTGLAILGHVVNALLVGPAAIALWRVRGRVPARTIAAGAGAFAGSAAIVAGLPYLIAAGPLGLGSPAAVLDWLTTYTRSGTWGFFEAATPLKAAAGTGRALIGGHFAFAIEPARGLLEARLGRSQSLREEIFLVRDLGGPAAALLGAIAVVALLALAALAARWLVRPPIDRPGRDLAWLAIGWIVPAAGFIVWWNPDNFEFWITTWIAVAALVAIPLRRPAGRIAPALVALGIAALAAVNFFGSVRPMQNPENDYWWVRSRWYAANQAPGDLVVATFYLWENYLRYFAGTRVLNLDPILLRQTGDDRAAIAEIRRAIAAAEARRVIVSGEVFAPAADVYSRCVGTGPLCQNPGLLHRDFRDRSRRIAEMPLETVWQLE